MTVTRSIYRVVRSILFTAVLTVVALIAIVYISISIPAVQRSLKNVAERELSALIGGRVSISSVEIFPFNELRLHGVSVYTPVGERCISVGRLGAGIDLWTLISSGEIEISYAEIISLDGRISQDVERGPLNIQFIIDALKGKQKKTPPSQFRVVLHNVVIRKSRLTFDREWQPRLADESRIDFNHLELTDLRADVATPLLANDDFSIDLRRLAFNERSGFVLKSLHAKVHVSPHDLSVSDFELKTENSDIRISDQTLRFDGYDDMLDALKRTERSVVVSAPDLYLTDFKSFYTGLNAYPSRFTLFADVTGDFKRLDILDFTLSSQGESIELSFNGAVDDVLTPKQMSAELKHFRLRTSDRLLTDVCSMLPSLSERAVTAIRSLGAVNLKTSGHLDMKTCSVNGSLDFSSGLGDLSAFADVSWADNGVAISEFSAQTESFQLGDLLGVNDLGHLSFDAKGHLSVSHGNLEGAAEVGVPFVVYRGNRFENISVNATKEHNNVQANVCIDNRLVSLALTGDCVLDNTASQWNVECDVSHIYPSAFGIGRFKPTDRLSAGIRTSLSGNNPDNLQGSFEIKNLEINTTRQISLNSLCLRSSISEELREFKVNTDFLAGSVAGHFTPTAMVSMVRNLIAGTIPDYVTPVVASQTAGQYARFYFTLPQDDAVYSLLNLPVRPGVPVNITGAIDGNEQFAKININAPYLIKGKDKLIKDTDLTVTLQSDRATVLQASTSFPLKNDRAALTLLTEADSGRIKSEFSWFMEGNRDNRGNVGFNIDIMRSPLDRAIDIKANLLESQFRLNGENWSISPAKVGYSSESLSVSGLMIGNGPQFVTIEGRASSNPLDVLTANLAGIDLEYIFDILNIAHVDFGGIATGKAVVSSLFTRQPMARTDGLFVKNLAYNGCVLGDGQLESHWDNEQKMVAINADVAAADTASAIVRGGVYVSRDSLSFDFDANKIDVRLLQPFMNGFTSSVTGKASGRLKLYGTFSDIDLGGYAFADPITMKVDYTNVCYTGSDSVFFTPGRITIPHIRLYDRYGQSAELKGEVRHDYLRDASFNFELTGAKRLLVYDTGPKLNPQWYGRVFADGSARIHGLPGLVSININMATSPNSQFTLVLDETQTAVDYTFLTFSDRRKEAADTVATEMSFEDCFRELTITGAEEHPDLFVMDMALDVTPGAELVIVMDPQAGDKIRAHGSGALQMHYDSDNDDFDLYGKYTLDRGDYNFSLQELILKNFKIQPGSSISFNGDPLGGILDITASYRVNTNLTDLDRSFANDPDLNRTSVPVDALLKVKGDIQTPEIKFDIKLPTVTSEVERKVRSIVSTEDMMNRQVIYLLALNRFYTPEYMGVEQGGELASVASSTLSSQIQNIVGSLTDKFSVAPSFKSEKSDFSDMEVDVALSSSLFDNRLLINGNLGYRDRSSSQTTFVGDFDIEYLLSRDGRLRLKAYNHFNDASYYLKSALTTQGIGIVYRKDFDDPFTFIKRMFRRKKKTGTHTTVESASHSDSTKTKENSEDI